MFKHLLKFLVVVLALLIAFAALLASEWLPPTRPENRAALEILRQPQPSPEGRNAFAVLWTLGRDLGGRDPDAQLRADVQAYEALPMGTEGFESLAPELPGFVLLKENLCPVFPEPCLPGLRALPDAGASLRNTYQDHLQASDGVMDADHFAYPFPMDGLVHFPRMGLTISLRRFANAQLFVAGDTVGGLANTCRELAAWRRIRPGSEILIHDMVAIAFAQTQAGNFAEMLAEWPADEPLPEACDLALAPLQEAELDQCRVWRGESRFMTGVVESDRGRRDEQADVSYPGWVREILFNRRNALERLAPEHASGCTGFPASALVDPGWMDWIFDPIGSAEWEKVAPYDMSGYRDRHLDHIDLLRTARILAWLGRQPDRAAAWENLPTDFGPAPERLAFEADGDRLVLTFRRQMEGRPWHWYIPLPPALPTRAPPG